MLMGMWLALRMFINLSGSGSSEFNYYRGAVLPMTSLNGTDGVDVKRNVDFDFSSYQDTTDDSTFAKGAKLVDQMINMLKKCFPHDTQK